MGRARTVSDSLFGASQGAAQLLTTSYVASATGSFDMGEFNQLTLFATIAGTAPTSVEILIEVSPDGSRWFNVGTETVAVGTVTTAYGLWNPPLNAAILGSATGSSRFVEIAPATKIRIQAKRTGGDATTSLHVEGIRSRM